jgi:hypothetical protein
LLVREPVAGAVALLTTRSLVQIVQAVAAGVVGADGYTVRLEYRPCVRSGDPPASSLVWSFDAACGVL